MLIFGGLLVFFVFFLPPDILEIFPSFECVRKVKTELICTLLSMKKVLQPRGLVCTVCACPQNGYPVQILCRLKTKIVHVSRLDSSPRLPA